MNAEAAEQEAPAAERPEMLAPDDKGNLVPMLISPEQAFMPVPMKLIEEAAQMIADAPGLAPEFSDMRNCRAIAYQAARWRMDPIAVASKTYFTPGKGNRGLVVGYEAQLVHALINANAPIREPLQFRYGYADPEKKTAAFRFVEIVGHLRGASRPSKLSTPTVAQIKVKNSPLWFSDPDQQLAYYGARAWARRFCPEVILGVYAREEFVELRDVTDESKRPSMFEEDDEPTPILDAEFSTIPPTEADIRRAEAGGQDEDRGQDRREERKGRGKPSVPPLLPPFSARSLFLR